MARISLTSLTIYERLVNQIFFVENMTSVTCVTVTVICDSFPHTGYISDIPGNGYILSEINSELLDNET